LEPSDLETKSSSSLVDRKASILETSTAVPKSSRLSTSVSSKGEPTSRIASGSSSSKSKQSMDSKGTSNSPGRKEAITAQDAAASASQPPKRSSNKSGKTDKSKESTSNKRKHTQSLGIGLAKGASTRAFSYEVEDFGSSQSSALSSPPQAKSIPSLPKDRQSTSKSFSDSVPKGQHPGERLGEDIEMEEPKPSRKDDRMDLDKDQPRRGRTSRGTRSENQVNPEEAKVRPNSRSSFPPEQPQVPSPASQTHPSLPGQAHFPSSSDSSATLQLRDKQRARLGMAAAGTSAERGRGIEETGTGRDNLLTPAGSPAPQVGVLTPLLKLQTLGDGTASPDDRSRLSTMDLDEDKKEDEGQRGFGLGLGLDLEMGNHEKSSQAASHPLRETTSQGTREAIKKKSLSRIGFNSTSPAPTPPALSTPLPSLPPTPQPQDSTHRSVSRSTSLVRNPVSTSSTAAAEWQPPTSIGGSETGNPSFAEDDGFASDSNSGSGSSGSGSGSEEEEFQDTNMAELEKVEEEDDDDLQLEDFAAELEDSLMNQQPSTPIEASSAQFQTHDEKEQPRKAKAKGRGKGKK